jgi:hypothetical protein
MAKEKTLRQEDLPKLRKTVFYDGEKERKQNRAANKHRKYRVKRVWNAETQKYEKVKVYKQSTTFTHKEMKERFNTKHVDIVITKKTVSISTTPHAKTINTKPATHCYIGIEYRQRLDWNAETLSYKAAA